MIVYRVPWLTRLSWFLRDNANSCIRAAFVDLARIDKIRGNQPDHDLMLINKQNIFVLKLTQTTLGDKPDQFYEYYLFSSN